jgi:hypothetical protein
MKKFQITLWCKSDPTIGFIGCYEYYTLNAENKRTARQYAKDNLLTYLGYSYKIVSVNEVK